MGRFVLAFLAISACTPSVIPAPLPVTPIDASDSGGDCLVAETITESRMIRVDGGASLVVPCP